MARRTATPKDAFKSIPQVVTKMNQATIELLCKYLGKDEKQFAKEIRILRGALPRWMVTSDEKLLEVIDGLYR